MLSGTLIFPIKPGTNWVGSQSCSADPPEIQLVGLMIEERHCCIENVLGIITLTARAETYVNGQLIGSTPVGLSHGDRVIIGGTHFFHLHYPSDPNLSRTPSVPAKVSLTTHSCVKVRNSLIM